MSVSVRNAGERVASLALEDPLPEGARLTRGSNRWEGSLDAGAEAAIDYATVLPRGVHEFPAIEAFAERPFAGSRSGARLPCPARAAVPPARLVPPEIAFAPASARAFAGESRARRGGEGADFSGTRPYSPGDRLRALNWRAEALWGEPVVNVFEDSRAIDAGIILDARAEAYESAALFESAVAAAACMAEFLLDGGHRVAFLSYGAAIEWTPPGSGREQRLRLREAAAAARLGAHAAFERFTNLPVELFPPRSLVLLVSPVLRDDLIPLRGVRARGYSLAVLRPEPGRAGAERGDAAALARRILDLEEGILLSRLLKAGIELIRWDISRPLAATRPLGGERR